MRRVAAQCPDAPSSEAQQRVFPDLAYVLYTLAFRTFDWGMRRRVTDQHQLNEREVDDAIAIAVAAAASLPLDQRKVLTVAVASDLTYLDIAEQGGFSPSQVLAWMREGLQLISAALDTGQSAE